MKSSLLLACLVFLVASTFVEAAVVSYDASEDVYIEWTIDDGGRSNRNSKGLLKQQWSYEPHPLDPNVLLLSDVVKSYIKFAVPADLATVNSVTLRLYNLNRGESDNDGDPVEIWALPDSLDGWDETVLDWNQATSTYANDPNGPYFTLGQEVGTGTCAAGKGNPTDFTLDASKMQTLVDADTDGVITLTIAAITTSYWCDRENSDPNVVPMLTWDYEIPEPATLSLVALGAAVVVGRRRRA